MFMSLAVKVKVANVILKEISKMKYMIHTYPKRLWYVEKYLVPSLVKQGIKKEDIFIFNDSNNRGNLQAFLDSLDYIKNNLSEEQGLWHLQDDVIISKDFKVRAEELGKDLVVNGFVNKYYANLNYIGKQKVVYYWYSFPCIYIPNKYIKEFLDFVDENQNIRPYKRRYEENRYDDWFFYKYLKVKHQKDYLINVVPNLVDHIDYLIGGTTGKRKNIQVRAEFFEDLDLVKELERSIKNELSQVKQKAKKTRKEI